MTNKQKFLIIIIILVLLGLIIGVSSYFGFEWFRPKQQNVSLVSPKVINYQAGEESKYWPSDFPKSSDFKTIIYKETQYTEELVILERTIKSPYPILPTFNFFKDYFDLNNWEVVKEEKNEGGVLQKLVVKREGYMTLTINPEETNTSLVYLRYEYNPKNPLKPADKQIFSKLPPFFPEYLIPKNSKIGGYNDSLNSYSPILFSEESTKSLYDFYLNNLKEHKWDIKFKLVNDFSAEIKAYNSIQNKNINIKINPVDDKIRSIIILLDK